MKKAYLGGLLLLSLWSCKPEQSQKTAASPAPAEPTAELTAVPKPTGSAYPWKLPAGPPEGPKADEIHYGEELITHTAQYLGPDVASETMRFTGSHLSCKNCHLQAGKQANAIGFVGVASRYPNFRARSNQVGDLKDRINGCMQRSLNGKPLPKDSREMNAMVAYMEWLSTGIPQGAKVEGQGTPQIELLDRAASPEAGKKIFAQKCIACHQQKGQGLPVNPQDLSQGYTFPPLWGPDSFNDGAGMHRLITASKYIKANMPLGIADLTAEEAFDVAAFINSMERPHKSGLDKDYPDRKLKPVDAPFPPYADTFPQQQHQYGPFKPILAARKDS